jgi:outer membrane lipoprotein-sorting protein
MRRLRTLPTRRLWAVVAALAVLALSAGIAQGALTGSVAKPPAKPLDRAVFDAVRAPDVAGISARIRFTNGLLPSGSLPRGSATPLLAGADGRLWLTGDGRFRLELQSDAGDAQITSDGKRLSVYDASSGTVYRMPLAAEPRSKRSEPASTLAGVRRALAQLARTWNLSGARPTATAGRPSYTVRISPKDDGGLLGAAELAWDSEKGVPLRAAVYAQGQSDPVLALEATDISYGKIASSDVSATPPAGTKVVDVGAPEHAAAGGKPSSVRGIAAVQKQLDFTLAAPDRLAGLPRRQVRLVRFGGETGALSTYGEGLGAIVVIQHRAGTGERSGLGGMHLPQVNIDGASGSELATALGTVVSFDSGGVAYTVAGSVPPLAAENAARGLR